MTTERFHTRGKNIDTNQSAHHLNRRKLRMNMNMTQQAGNVLLLTHSIYKEQLSTIEIQKIFFDYFPNIYPIRWDIFIHFSIQLSEANLLCLVSPFHPFHGELRLRHHSVE